MKTLLTLCLLVVSTLSLAQEPYHLRSIPFDPGGTGTVVTRWILHLGNQDPGETNHENYGLLMSKNSASTTVNSAGFAQVYLSNGSTTLNIHVTELGYDIRNGSHCGAGSPRFNVITDVAFHFVGGCSNGTITPSTIPGWQHVRFDTATQSFPPILPTETVKKIYLVVDEGTDTGPDFSGVDILDDIEINGILIGEPN